MCPSSSMSSVTGISDLLKNYRFITADKSQVCDGRNFESVRLLLGTVQSPKMTGKNGNEKPKPKDVDDPGVGITNSYRPVRRRFKPLRKDKAHPRQRIETQQQMQQITQQQPINSKANSFLPSPLGLESDHTLDDSCRPDLFTERWGQDSSHLEAEKFNKQEGTSKQNEQLGNSVESDYSKLRRKSANDCASDSSSEGKVTLRKLSEPMHRCNLTNANVNGIMRPARYSTNNLLGMAYTGSSTSKSSNGCIPKSVSHLSLRSRPNSNRIDRGYVSGGSLSRSSGSLNPISSKTITSTADMKNEEWGSFPTPDKNAADQEAKDRWVASGVEFSKSMEVYIFRTSEK